MHICSYLEGRICSNPTTSPSFSSKLRAQGRDTQKQMMNIGMKVTLRNKWPLKCSCYFFVIEVNIEWKIDADSVWEKPQQNAMKEVDRDKALSRSEWTGFSEIAHFREYWPYHSQCLDNEAYAGRPHSVRVQGTPQKLSDKVTLIEN